MRRTSDAAQFVVGSAVFMGLGWLLLPDSFIRTGLCAYLPGSLLALWLCLLLHIEFRRAAPIVAIAALGFAQAAFLNRSGVWTWTATPWAALLQMGCCGLQGFTFGAFLGLGFVSHRVSMPHFFLLLLGHSVACGVGLRIMARLHDAGVQLETSNADAAIHIYGTLDLWFGLLLGTSIVLLGLRVLGLLRVPGRFALYAAIGGAGSCGLLLILTWIVDRAGLPALHWPLDAIAPWIRGAGLGAAGGLCASALRGELSDTADAVPRAKWRARELAILGLAAALIGIAWYQSGQFAAPPLETGDAVQGNRIHDRYIAVFLKVCAMSSFFMFWSARTVTIAWQVALTAPVIGFMFVLLESYAQMVVASPNDSLLWIQLPTVLYVGALVFLWHYRANRSLAPVTLWMIWTCAACQMVAVLADMITDNHSYVLPLFRTVLMGACAIYGTVALWPWRKVGDAQAAA